MGKYFIPLRVNQDGKNKLLNLMSQKTLEHVYYGTAMKIELKMFAQRHIAMLRGNIHYLYHHLR